MLSGAPAMDQGRRHMVVQTQALALTGNKASCEHSSPGSIRMKDEVEVCWTAEESGGLLLSC